MRPTPPGGETTALRSPSGGGGGDRGLPLKVPKRHVATPPSEPSALSIVQQAALTARSAVVAPLRRAKLGRHRAAGTAPAMVLFYHRVATNHPNDWTITPETFDAHLRHLRRVAEPVELTQVQRSVRDGVNDRSTFTVTFDDGYAENEDYAIPTLLRRRIPTTYFVSTHHVIAGKPFPHDVAAGRRLPVNTVSQIRQFADAGIEIGCHTRDHVDLSKIHRPADLRRQIVEDKDALEQLIGRGVRYFAFPFGMPPQLTAPAIAAVIEAGFEGFCSAFGAYNVVGRDWYHIRRFHGDPEMSRLVNWTSYDETKVRGEPKIEVPADAPIRAAASRRERRGSGI